MISAPGESASTAIRVKVAAQSQRWHGPRPQMPTYFPRALQALITGSGAKAAQVQECLGVDANLAVEDAFQPGRPASAPVDGPAWANRLLDQNRRTAACQLQSRLFTHAAPLPPPP